jgi:hypothetical protein
MEFKSPDGKIIVDMEYPVVIEKVNTGNDDSDIIEFTNEQWIWLKNLIKKSEK